MKLDTVFLLLGGNLGNRKVNLEKASRQLERLIGTITKRSACYETKAWGKTDQPDFLNQVILVETEMPVEQILDSILNIEQKLGRTRSEKWGARLIDIDLLYAGDKIINSEKLTLPHPGIPERRFVLEPLVEIAPDYIHPGLNKSHRQLLDECSDKLAVKKI